MRGTRPNAKATYFYLRATPPRSHSLESQWQLGLSVSIRAAMAVMPLWGYHAVTGLTAGVVQPSGRPHLNRSGAKKPRASTHIQCSLAVVQIMYLAVITLPRVRAFTRHIDGFSSSPPLKCVIFRVMEEPARSGWPLRPLCLLGRPWTCWS